MKKSTNNNSEIQKSPAKRKRTNDPRVFITPPRVATKPDIESEQQPWSVGAKKTQSRGADGNSLDITRNCDFPFPNNKEDVLRADFVAKYNILEEISGEIATLQEQLQSLHLEAKKNKEVKKTHKPPKNEQSGQVANRRLKVARINSMLENIFIQLLPKLSSSSSIDDTLKKIISDLNKPDRTEIINTLVTAINKSYDNSKNSTSKNDSFSNRLQIIKLLNDSTLDYGSKNPWSRIHEYNEILLQLKFELELEKLGIHFTSLSRIHKGSTKRTRIVFTNLSTSLEGFKHMQNWFAANPEYSENIKDALKNAGAVQVNAHPSRPATLDLEMAWSHLMNDDRHVEENIIFVGYIQALEYALKFCTIDSTLVLHAHGGQNEFSINKMTSEGPKLSILKGPVLISYMKSLVEIINEKITHVILATCATGSLSANSNIKTLDKHTIEDDKPADLRRQKNRKKVFIDETSTNNKLADVLGAFVKLSIGCESVAATLANLLFTRPNQNIYYGTALTLSPTIIHPGIMPDGGLIAAPKGLDANRRDWPAYNTDWQVDGSGLALKEVAYKSYTLFNNLNNRKATGELNAWKQIPRTMNLKSVPQDEIESKGVFASFGWIIFELVNKKILTTENKFIAHYDKALISPKVLYDQSGSSAVMNAFVQSILHEESIPTPFDYDMTLLCDKILYGIDVLGSEHEANDLIYREFKVLILNLHANLAQELRNGAVFYEYLRVAHPELIAAIKESYCKAIGATRNQFRPRHYDMIYIANKLGCFSQVHEHGKIDDPAASNRNSKVNVYVLNKNPADLTLHIVDLADKGWQAYTNDIDSQYEIAAQQRKPNHTIMNWQVTSFMLFKNKNESSITWNAATGLELGGFAAFTIPIQDLCNKNLLDANNLFFRLFSEWENNNGHLEPKFRSAMAIKAAFSNSILQDTIGLETPFDYDMNILCNQIILNEINDMEESDDYHEGLIDFRYKAHIREIFDEYQSSRRDTVITSSEFYEYLQQNKSELINKIRESYCTQILESNNEFLARENDMIYIADKLGCFERVEIYDSVTGNKTETHVLSSNPDGLTLHLRPKGNKWEAADLTIGESSLTARKKVKRSLGFGQY